MIMKALLRRLGAGIVPAVLIPGAFVVGWLGHLGWEQWWFIPSAFSVVVLCGMFLAWAATTYRDMP